MAASNLSRQSPAPERERRGGGDGGLFVRTERSLAGFELGTYALGALLRGKSRGKDDGCIYVKMHVTLLSFFFLFFFFSVSKKIEGKEKGKICKCLLQEVM
jgi:hypothetical protein